MQYEDKLKEAFYIEPKNDEFEVHPKRFCLKCYKQSLNITSRGSTAATPYFLYKKHSSESCATCDNLALLLKGGRKKKSKKIGRPSEENTIWSREFSKILIKKIPDDDFPFATQIAFNLSSNPQLEVCLCLICRNIMLKPVKIETCEHGFCLRCFLTALEGHSIRCPECNKPFHEEQVSTYRTVISLRKKLVVVCHKCGKKYPHVEYDQYLQHTKICTNSQSFELMDILSIPTTTKIPPAVEKVASHVVKLKMAESKMPNKIIQLPSGSSTVRI